MKTIGLISKNMRKKEFNKLVQEYHHSLTVYELWFCGVGLTDTDKILKLYLDTFTPKQLFQNKEIRSQIYERSKYFSQGSILKRITKKTQRRNTESSSS